MRKKAEKNPMAKVLQMKRIHITIKTEIKCQSKFSKKKKTREEKRRQFNDD